jgi:transketolase
MGDGELSEGQLWEAAMAASRFRLDRLTAFVDRNGIQATGPTKEIFDIPDIESKASRQNKLTDSKLLLVIMRSSSRHGTSLA